MVSTVKTQLDEQNAKASQREVDQFVSEKPLVWYGYLSADETTLTTWTGQKIASVTFRSTPFRVLRGCSSIPISRNKRIDILWQRSGCRNVDSDIR
jgi:hypothetical protein